MEAWSLGASWQCQGEKMAGGGRGNPDLLPRTETWVPSATPFPRLVGIGGGGGGS